MHTMYNVYCCTICFMIAVGLQSILHKDWFRHVINNVDTQGNVWEPWTMPDVVMHIKLSPTRIGKLCFTYKSTRIVSSDFPISSGICTPVVFRNCACFVSRSTEMPRRYEFQKWITGFWWTYWFQQPFLDASGPWCSRYPLRIEWICQAGVILFRHLIKRSCTYVLLYGPNTCARIWPILYGLYTEKKKKTPGQTSKVLAACWL